MNETPPVSCMCLTYGRPMLVLPIGFDQAIHLTTLILTFHFLLARKLI